ncbi:MAG: ThiF family adenylyltransferase [Armatimonadetes bacterium]|nr:ThiF family adenylyltransferase [Armatimonadota bacterium]
MELEPGEEGDEQDLQRGGRDPQPQILDVETEEDRYSRLRLIHWWDQDKLRSARAMVVGAGALGNEIVKNLALLGIGGIFIVDFDTIESTNLSRSVLFRAGDVGRRKVQAAADMARQINPQVVVEPVHANIVYDVGTGVFSEMDLIFGALDNREARVAINSFAWRVGKAWIDGAIEVMRGVARVFVPPDGPCYECTMSEMDYKLLSVRRSCALLTREEVELGKVPTTPTIASIIGGLQVQEGIKMLHSERELPFLAGRGYIFDGVYHQSYVVEYQRREDCPAHYTYPELQPRPWSVFTTTGADLFAAAQEQMGDEAVVEFEREVCVGLRCTQCGTYERRFGALSQITEEEARCPQCGQVRDPDLIHALYGHEDFLDLPLAELGLPPYDAVTFRQGLEMKHYLLADDRRLALGKLASLEGKNDG